MFHILTTYVGWDTLDDFLKFQFSPACAEFLRNLPEHAGDSPQAPIESGSAMSHLTLDNTSSSSPPAPPRFQILQHATEAATPEASGLVTFTTFLVPHQVDDKYAMWRDKFTALNTFAPHNAKNITTRYFWQKSTHVWYWLVAEDRWVWEKFGKPEQKMHQGPGRTILCHFFLWSPHHGGPEEHEAAAENEKVVAADPQARESWIQAIARVMPPATAWVQERWNMREVPRFFPPEPEFDPEDPEHEAEKTDG